MNIFKNREAQKAKQFAELTKDCTEKEKRDIEQSLLKPDPLGDKGNKRPIHNNDLSARSALIVFRDEVQKKMISELFAVRTNKMSGETYITNIAILENFAKNVRDGSMRVIDERICSIVEGVPQKIKSEPSNAIAD